MELGELIGAFVSHVDDDKPACPATKPPPDPNWKARINEHGTLKGCSGTRLYESMDSLFKGKRKFGYLGGPKPYIEKKKVTWSYDTVDKKQFPIQAHHLIPKNHLPEHPVCTFLAKGYTKNKKYQLTADTAYDTDHANNGYCLPYATPLQEWKRAGSDDDVKRAICFEVMESTQRQLHQGSHRARPYVEDPADPDEEASIHPTGYLNAVDLYLKAVFDAGQKHADICRVCKKNAAKKEVQPREETVAHVDKASGIIKLLVDANRIFISEPAWLWWKDNPKKLVKPKWLK